MNKDYKLAMAYRDVVIDALKVITEHTPELSSAIKEKLRELDSGKFDDESEFESY